MTGSRLPSGLAAWSEQLSALRPDIAIALGPMLHRLDELVGRHSAVDAPDGVPDGVPDGLGGLTRRGVADRMLISQWALAQDVPEEFLRRAAMGELLYLAQARTHDTVRGRSVLLVDTGPDLHGGPRLAQLAMALVLHRRATAAGAEFRLGVLTSPAGSWLEGDLPAMLEAWLGARGRRPATVEDLRAWADVVERPEQAWAVIADRLARASSGAVPASSGMTGRWPRRVVVQESDWTEAGPTALVVGLAGERVHLPLPALDLAVRVLRGQGWRRTAPTRTSSAGGGLRQMRLPGAAPFLLARGADAHRLVTQRVPDPGAQTGQPRVRRFPGPVLAASRIGTRWVALVAVDDVLEVRIVGKRLADVDRIRVPLTELGLMSADVDSLAAEPPAELFFRSGELLVRLGGSWWRLSPAGTFETWGTTVAVSPSTEVDVPLVAMHFDDHLWVALNGGAGRFGPVQDSGPVPETHLGAGAIAWQDGGGWRLADLVHQTRPITACSAAPSSPDPGVPVDVDTGTKVVGVTRIGDVPGLVTVGGGGVLVRFVSRQGTRTLTRWSGGIAPPALHARLPLIAVEREDGVVEVGDLGSGQVRLRVESLR